MALVEGPVRIVLLSHVAVRVHWLRVVAVLVLVIVVRVITSTATSVATILALHMAMTSVAVARRAPIGT